MTQNNLDTPVLLIHTNHTKIIISYTDLTHTIMNPGKKDRGLTPDSISPSSCKYLPPPTYFPLFPSRHTAILFTWMFEWYPSPSLWSGWHMPQKTGLTYLQFPVVIQLSLRITMCVRFNWKCHCFHTLLLFCSFLLFRTCLIFCVILKQ